MLNVHIEPTGQAYIDDVEKNIKTLKQFEKIKFPEMEEIQHRMFDRYDFFDKQDENGTYIELGTFIEVKENIKDRFKIDFGDKIELSNIVELIYNVLIENGTKELKSTKKIKEPTEKDIIDFLRYRIDLFGVSVFEGIGKNKEYTKQFEDIVLNDFNNEMVFELDEAVELGKYCYASPRVTIKVIQD